MDDKKRELYASIVSNATKKINGEIKEKDWKCPGCESNSISLIVFQEHQRFEDHYRKLKQLIQCSGCGSKFLFEYELKNIEIRSIKKVNYMENCPGCNARLVDILVMNDKSEFSCEKCGYAFGKPTEEVESD